MPIKALEPCLAKNLNFHQPVQKVRCEVHNAPTRNRRANIHLHHKKARQPPKCRAALNLASEVQMQRKVYHTPVCVNANYRDTGMGTELPRWGIQVISLSFCHACLEVHAAPPMFAHSQETLGLLRRGVRGRPRSIHRGGVRVRQPSARLSVEASSGQREKQASATYLHARLRIPYHRNSKSQLSHATEDEIRAAPQLTLAHRRAHEQRLTRSGRFQAPSLQREAGPTHGSRRGCASPAPRLRRRPPSRLLS